uniref:Fibronectin type-III domain-containing protein n=1 Tax=Crocodylus porosus TaxID=8502 RepID=A0A7M4FXB8_CROPO
MEVTVQNITGSTARVIWPKMASCADSFYSIMYHPNWNSVLSGYSRKSFQKEERVPASRSSFVIENLTPLTTYILCVTCQSANPSSDQCKIFHTLKQDATSASSKKKDLALGIWLTSSILLLIIAGILLYGCLHIWCRKRQAPRWYYHLTWRSSRGGLIDTWLGSSDLGPLSCQGQGVRHDDPLWSLPTLQSMKVGEKEKAHVQKPHIREPRKVQAPTLLPIGSLSW